MKKGIIIVGPRGSGKTTKAKEIASQYEQDEVVWQEYVSQINVYSLFYFSQCTPETKLIIMQNSLDDFGIGFYYKAIIEGLVVNKKGEKPFIIYPQFVFEVSSNSDFQTLSARFEDRFDIIEMKGSIETSEKVTLNVEFLFSLNSKREWINRVPAILPAKKQKAEEWVWIDTNGNSLAIGEDFAAAEEMDSYPVKVYRKIRVTEALKQVDTLTKPERIFYELL